jgi:hypothetical protein
MARRNSRLTAGKHLANFGPVKPLGDIPLYGEIWHLRLHDGPIVVDGVSHASYASVDAHTIDVDRFIPEPSRLLTVACAVAAVAQNVEALARLAVPLLGSVD